MLLHIFAIFLLSSSFLFNAILSAPTGCTINVSKLQPEPIIVSTDTKSFLYGEPSSKINEISIPAGSSVLISCPGSNFKLGTSSPTTVEATCVSGSTFKADNQTFEVSSIKCGKEAFHTARYTGRACESQGREIEVGFVLDSKNFAQELIICFDPVNLSPFYSTYNLTKSIGLHESGIERITFIEDNFYANLSEKVNNMYVRGGQKSTINKLLGLPPNSTLYIKDTGDFYLARGHLTAKADFVYAHQQLATFHYVNVAPQWQTFNGNNWATVEANVRDYANAQGLDLRVYTGIYGVATLPHATSGLSIPLYLYVDGSTKALPVPELYWKVVYDPQTQLGVAILGENNPYLKTKNTICTDISSRLKWLNVDTVHPDYGHIYACSVQDLAKKVAYLPQFNVKGVLL